MKLKSKGEIHAYFEGKLEGVRLYAWWEHGIQVIGTTGRTLETAEQAIARHRDEALKTFTKNKEVWVL